MGWIDGIWFSWSYASWHSLVRHGCGMNQRSCRPPLGSSFLTCPRGYPGPAAGAMIWYAWFLDGKVKKAVNQMSPVLTTVALPVDSQGFFTVPLPAITVCMAVAPETGARRRGVGPGHLHTPPSHARSLAIGLPPMQR